VVLLLVEVGCVLVAVAVVTAVAVAVAVGVVVRSGSCHWRCVVVGGWWRLCRVVGVGGRCGVRYCAGGGAR